MKTAFIGLLTLSLAGALAAADATAGKAVYEKHCRSCHGADGKGNPAIAKALKVDMHALGSPAVQAKTDAELVKDTTQGTGKMKPVRLADAEAADVVQYVRTLK